MSRLQPRLPPAVALALLLASFILSPAWPSNTDVTYRSYSREFWRYALGKSRRYDFLDQFRGRNGYDYRSQERLGKIIRDRARPGDRLHVRGFEPAIYALSGLYSPSRIFAEFPFVNPRMGGWYHRREWRIRHRRAIRENPPRFIVTFHRYPEYIDPYLRKGYRRIAKAGNLALLERTVTGKLEPFRNRSGSGLRARQEKRNSGK